MDEDIAAINSSTNIEKIRNYLNKNKKTILSIFLFLLMILILFFGYNEYKKSEKIKTDMSNFLFFIKKSLIL